MSAVEPLSKVLADRCHAKLAERAAALEAEIKRLRTLVVETAVVLDYKDQCPDRSAYADGHCDLIELARAAIGTLDVQKVRLEGLQSFMRDSVRSLDAASQSMVRALNLSSSPYEKD